MTIVLDPTGCPCHLRRSMPHLVLRSAERVTQLVYAHKGIPRAMTSSFLLSISKTAIRYTLTDQNLHILFSFYEGLCIDLCIDLCIHDYHLHKFSITCVFIPQSQTTSGIDQHFSSLIPIQNPRISCPIHCETAIDYDCPCSCFICIIHM